MKSILILFATILTTSIISQTKTFSFSDSIIVVGQEHTTRQIYFELGKATLKPESNPFISRNLATQMRIQDIINEINQLKTASPRKAAFDIFKLLDNNGPLFTKCLEPDTFRLLHSRFEGLANASAKEYNSESFKTEVEKSCGLLGFYLDKVI